MQMNVKFFIFDLHHGFSAQLLCHGLLPQATFLDMSRTAVPFNIQFELRLILPHQQNCFKIVTFHLEL